MDVSRHKTQAYKTTTSSSVQQSDKIPDTHRSRMRCVLRCTSVCVRRWRPASAWRATNSRKLFPCYSCWSWQTIRPDHERNNGRSHFSNHTTAQVVCVRHDASSSYPPTQRRQPNRHIKTRHIQTNPLCQSRLVYEVFGDARCCQRILRGDGDEPR